MISIVIPVLNERDRLPACLDSVVEQARATGAELLVVDGGSDDGTVEVAQGYPEVRLIRSASGRGRQMNAGAAVATGSLLVFLPADTTLPRNALEALSRIDAVGSRSAGGFRQRFDSPRRFLRVISYLTNLRATLTGVVYGDQVPYVDAATFRDLGGFREGIDLEDLEFGTRLRRRARVRLLDLTVTTSARRFDAAGDLRATAVAAWILLVWTLTRRIPRSRTFFSRVR